MTARKERSIIESIREKLIKKRFTTKELRLQIFIYSLIYDEKKYDLIMSKFIGILSKIIFNQH